MRTNVRRIRDRGTLPMDWLEKRVSSKHSHHRLNACSEFSIPLVNDSVGSETMNHKDANATAILGDSRRRPIAWMNAKHAAFRAMPAPIASGSIWALSVTANDSP